ncbi:hypothetical protein [Lysinibacillus fusiformis]|nr:hypothetical protein [Lysinibacillus fusiformis]NOG26762.1 hypothetical protein [Lysinibacillus fusiformis]
MNSLTIQLKQTSSRKNFDKSHLDKFDTGTLTGGDFEGLKIIIVQHSA